MSSQLPLIVAGFAASTFAIKTAFDHVPATGLTTGLYNIPRDWVGVGALAGLAGNLSYWLRRVAALR